MDIFSLMKVVNDDLDDDDGHVLRFTMINFFFQPDRLWLVII